MINWHAHIEFLNCHPESRESGAWQLPRHPASVRQTLNERGRIFAMDSWGVELRFVTPAPDIHPPATEEKRTAAKKK